MKTNEASTAGRPEIGNPTSKILGVHPGALGDVILFGEFLEALRRTAGAAGASCSVGLVARGRKAGLLAGLGVVDRAMDFDALPMEEVFGEADPQDSSLPKRLGDCELLVSCFAAGNARAEQRLASLCSARRAVFLPIRPPEDFAGHLVDAWARQSCVESVAEPHWPVPASWRQEARRALVQVGAETNRPYLLIHPGSGSREKCWPLGRFLELAGLVAAGRQRLRSVFVLGPAEMDWWASQTVSSVRSEFPTVVCPPLSALAGLAAGAKAYLGNDSGPTHLAAAVGAPTVAIFGPSSPVRFAPRGRRVRIVADRELAGIGVRSISRALQEV